MLLGETDFSVQLTHCSPQADSLFVVFQGRKLWLAGQGETLRLPTWAEAEPLCPKGFQPFELAHTAGRSLFAPQPFEAFALTKKAGFSWQDVQVFRTLPARLAGLITSCWHLWSWYQSHRYCGSCGHTLTPDGQERALDCTRCGAQVFPVIAPAVIVAITCGDSILLAKNKRYDHYGLVAGYVEVGESLEHAVRREVREEVGLELGALRYVGDQPWGISGSQMVGFQAEAPLGQTIVLQKSELSDAHWVRRADLQPCARPFSVAAELIERFRLGML